jgi:hypothetical protein
MSENPPALVVRRKRSFLIPGAVVLLALVLVLGGLWWWQNRAIRPVKLSKEEQVVVEAKVEAIQKPAEPEYEPGTKEIVFTERELNGLLNQNTDLGESLSFQLATGAVHARLESDLDPGIPLVGGKRLKVRALLRVANSEGGAALVLEDLSVWGVSLPNDWLGGLKGRDLLAETLGSGDGRIAGIKDLAVEPGRLRIVLDD